MERWDTILFVAYVSLLGVLSIYGLHRYALLFLYFRHYKRNVRPRPPMPATLPSVTVQLPLYNERYVARRVIEAAARLRYPRHLLRVQVLDDSVGTGDIHQVIMALGLERAAVTENAVKIKIATIRENNARVRALNDMIGSVQSADRRGPDTSDLKAVGEQMRDSLSPESGGDTYGSDAGYGSNEEPQPPAAEGEAPAPDAGGAEPPAEPAAGSSDAGQADDPMKAMQDALKQGEQAQQPGKP